MSTPSEGLARQRQAVVDAVLERVVTPVLDELLRPTEIDSVRVSWREVRWPKRSDDVVGPDAYTSVLSLRDVEWESDDKLVLDLVAAGESFEHYFFVTHLNVTRLDLKWLEHQLYSDLQDFISESSFGWGELRGRR